PANSRNHRRHPPDLLLGGYRGGTRSGRFPPNVDQVRPGMDQGFSSSQRSPDLLIRTPIAEAIGRDIENPHEQRSALDRRRSTSQPGLKFGWRHDSINFQFSIANFQLSIVSDGEPASSAIAPLSIGLASCNEPNLRTAGQVNAVARTTTRVPIP